MMTTMCRILWMPVAGAILIFKADEIDAGLRGLAGTSARHR